MPATRFNSNRPAQSNLRLEQGVGIHAANVQAIRRPALGNRSDHQIGVLVDHAYQPHQRGGVCRGQAGDRSVGGP